MYVLSEGEDGEEDEDDDEFEFEEASRSNHAPRATSTPAARDRGASSASGAASSGAAASSAASSKASGKQPASAAPAQSAHASSKVPLPDPIPLHIGGASGTHTSKKEGGKDVAGAMDRFTAQFSRQQNADRQQQAILVKRQEKEAERERAHQKELAETCKTQ